MSESRDVAVREFLDLLEREETKLLSWGVVDGGFSAEELETFALRVIDDLDTQIEPGALVQELFDRRLLFAFRGVGYELHRTRVGESVRLFARLRQMFPGRPWQIAPTLVADFRFARRARCFPRRTIAPDSVLTRLSECMRLSTVRRDALAALLGRGEPEPLNLAEFQYHATRRVLLDLDSRNTRGLIISAGTGTGKTLAFYLPALTHIAGLVERNAFWTKAVAIYPRNELLKDQLAEVYAQARRLDSFLLQKPLRKISIGAFYKDTPRDAPTFIRFKSWGEPVGGGYVCPYLRCPRCQGDLLWRTSDVASGVERLHCPRAACGATIMEDEVLLTRNRMAASPPDILFTTTEMLNRRIGDSEFGRVFGVGPNVRRPQLVLLDEVHTYAGISGAQVALLLRRWRHAIGAKLQFTGLSATLRGANEFFALLVGLRAGAVEEVAPRDAELDPVPESVEYLLALRGDPVSAASLLSTTIQSSMLLRRILDPSTVSTSRGMFGRRVFLFTDDLDVTNRLYHNLLHAEGYDPEHNPPRPTEPILAELRSTSRAENSLRLAYGQSWQLCEDIGHPYGLANRIRVSRTSSQDAGVDQGSDVVVATASLEVGYNDPDVGAVLQHKAPRDRAAYLQRKGRAGRSRAMRPLTVVVLSDYGRDRIAYQSYDQLFDPELPHRSLPVANRYVLRMQAAFALMDWVASEIPDGTVAGSVWTDFSGPPAGWREREARERQRHELQILSEVLDGNPGRCRSLEAYVKAALSLTVEETQSVLWDPPRPLLLSVVPTLHRRLESGWRRMHADPGEPAHDYLIKDHPLPDFVPQQLFGDLNLPEVEVLTDPARAGQELELFFVPILQAVQVLAPGRVTRRFGYKLSSASHWSPPPNLHDAEQFLAVEDLCELYDEAGIFQVLDGGTVTQVRCVRPWRIHPQQVPNNISPSSNAFLEWRSQIAPAREDERMRFEPPLGTGWERILEDVCFYTHGQRNHAVVRRFAIASQANILFKNGNQLDARIKLMSRDGGPAAVGYFQESDGIAFRFRVPEELGLAGDHPNRRVLRAFRVAYFRNSVRHDHELGRIANLFQRDWLAQVYLSAVASRALARGMTLEDADREIGRGDIAATLDEVFSAIFQSVELPNGQQAPQRMRDELGQLCRDPAVTNALARMARSLWSEPDAEWLNWAVERYKATLGGILLEACSQSCPELEAGDLYLDINAGPRPPEAPTLPEGISEVWVSEATIGGGGVIEEILRSFVADPRRFFRIAESALSATDYEVVDRELTRILALSENDSEVNAVFATVRGADNHADLASATVKLRRLLARRGMAVTHPVMSAVHSRLLRPGSSPASDGLLRDIVGRWNGAEETLGVELDPRVYAFIAAQDQAITTRLGAIESMPAHDTFWRFQTIYGLLWPRSYQVRALGLSCYNPFAEAAPPDRELVLDVFRGSDPIIRLGPDCEVAVARALAAHGTARIVAAPGERHPLKETLLSLVSVPMEVGFLHLYPRVVSLTEEPDELSATLDLREVLP